MPILPAVALLLASPTSNPHETWNRFRGPDGAGVAGGVRLPDALDLQKNLAWSADLPPGHSSPCLTDERAFVTGSADGVLATLCIDRKDGRVLWTRSVKPGALERFQEQNGPASPSPASDGQHVVAYFGSYGLVAYDLEGKELWQRKQALPKNTFGTAVSPVIAGGKLIFLSDNDEGSFLEAIDPATGASLWRRARDGYTSGWSTPGVWTRDGELELLVLGVGWLNAYSLADGAERWSYPGLTDEPITVPISGDGLVFATSYNLKSNVDAMSLWSYDKVLVEHDLDGDGAISIEEAKANKSLLSRPDADGEGDHPMMMFQRFLDVDRDGSITAKEYEKLEGWVASWEHLNGIVALRPPTKERGTELAWHFPRGVPECPSPLHFGGRIYMVMNGGTVTCLDAKSGALVFQDRLPARGPYYASLVGGDGKLYAASARGEVTVFAAEDKLRVLASTDLGERLMATPALSDGSVYVRTETKLRAFGGPTPRER
jgi:outer membrane protein assembly factor BamB